MSQGWIKLYRQIQECDIWNNGEPFDMAHAWIDLLLLANHKDKKMIFDGKPLVVKRGQRITSIRKLAERWHWSVNKTARYLKLLEELEMVTKESDNHRTLLTIIKYEVFQGECDTLEYTDGTHSNTQTEHARIHTRTTNKNDKNEKNEKNDKNDKNNKLPFGEFQNVKLTQEEYDRLGNDYGPDQRKAAIKYLDEYIEEKGYKSKSNNLSIRRWVVNAITEHGPEPKKQGQSEFMARLQEAIKRKEDENANSG